MKTMTLATTIIVAAIFVSAAVAEKAHDHDHSHKADKEQADGDHQGHDHHGHSHDKKQPGPNGGRIITSVEPHIELFVRDDRKVQIAILDEELKVVAPSGQEFSAVGGSRANPTKLSFAVDGEVFVSDAAWPDGKDLPIILEIKMSAEGKTERERFQVNLKNCPTCVYLEYACICAHSH